MTLHLRRAGLAAVAAILTLSAVAQAGVQTGTSGWQWGNPLPQGNELAAMAFNGTTGYAAGDFGTLLKTTDGGGSWTGLRTGTAAPLFRVHLVDATTLVTGGPCVARRSTDGGQSFTRIAFAPVESSCDDPLQDLSFVTPDTGWLLQNDGAVQQTTDGGQTFSPRTAVPGTRAAGGQAFAGAISFRTPTTGYATTNVGTIFVTADGGQSWKQAADAGVPLTDLLFVGDQRVFASGPSGVVARSDDGGTTWVTRPTGASKLTGLACASPTTCLLATGSTTLLRTTDGLATAPTAITASNDAFNAVGFASATRAVAGGVRGATVVSDDGGLTSAAVGGRLDGAFTSVVAGAGSGGLAFAPGPRGTLGRTTDAGQTWTRGNIGTTGAILGVSFPSATQGFALDDRSGLFRTTNGAASWAPLDTGTTGRVTDLLAPARGTVLVVGPGGLRRSTDAGDSFGAVSAKALRSTSLSGLDLAGPRVAVAWGRKDLVLSTTSGASWRALNLPGKATRTRAGKRVTNAVLREVDFASANVGWIITDRGVLYRTTNSGRSWTELAGTGTAQGGTLAMASTRQGFLTIPSFGDVGKVGVVLRTSDGGTTWRPQVVAQQAIDAGGVAAGPDGTGYALAGDGLLRTTTGGDTGAASSLGLRVARAQLTKPGTVTVNGRLSPARGNERVTVSFRAGGSFAWRSQTVRVAANGSFTASVRTTRGTNTVVAQWPGDFRSAGDGSPPLAITVAKRK